jgi:hypothetical protein
MLGRVVLLLMTTLLALGQYAEAANTTTPALATGQMWSIKSPSPTTAKVIIGRVEQWNQKIVMHISVIDVPIPSCMPGAGQLTIIQHMPFEQSALAASLDRLLATNAPPASKFEDGYNQWRAAQGGIYTISVSKAVDTVLGCR